LSLQSEKNTVIIIGENDEDSDPLIPGEIVQSRLKQTHVFVPRLSAGKIKLWWIYPLVFGAYSLRNYNYFDSTPGMSGTS
jgi:hypothetical protein